MREFARTTPIVVVTGMADAHEGAEATQLGAREVLMKPVEDHRALCRLVALEAVRGKLQRLAGRDRFLRGSVERLCDTHPDSIIGWAVACDADESWLRRCWVARTGIHPKTIMFLHDLYRTAIECVAIGRAIATGRSLRRLSRRLRYLETHLAGLMPLIRRDGPPGAA